MLSCNRRSDGIISGAACGRSAGNSFCSTYFMEILGRKRQDMIQYDSLT